MFNFFNSYFNRFSIYLNTLVSNISHYRYAVCFYYVVYLYYLCGLSLVLHFVNISPSLFVEHLKVFPSLNGLFWYDLLSEFISDSVGYDRVFVDNFDDLFILLWSDTSDVSFFLFLYYMSFVSSWVT
jgi:hypothetical protein